jgi:hypothetical protein
MDERAFVFNADGTGEYDDVYSGNISGCTGNLVVKYKGNVVIDTGAATITVYATDVTETTVACAKSSTKTDPAQTLSFAYTDAPYATGPAIMITDSKCAAKYDDQAAKDLYCRYTYYKQ